MHAARRRPQGHECHVAGNPAKRGPPLVVDLSLAGWYLCITPLSPPVRFDSPLPPQLNERRHRKPVHPTRPVRITAQPRLIRSLPPPVAQPIRFRYLASRAASLQLPPWWVLPRLRFRLRLPGYARDKTPRGELGKARL